MPVGYEPLHALRVTRVIQALQDQRNLLPNLVWASRIPQVNALEGEIFARFINRVQIADLVADDARATVYSAGKFNVESTSTPNLKMGRKLTQEQMMHLNQINAFGPTAPGVDTEVFGDFLNQMATDRLNGIEHRKEALLVAMLLDGLSYDRLGIKMSSVSWGMPTDLNVTVSNGWSDATNGTPVNDIYGLILVARVRYGINFDRLTMSTPAFRFMIATTEFQAKARTFLAPNVSYVNLPLANLSQQKNIAEQVLGLNIEFYDARYWSQDLDSGIMSSFPFMPLNKVIFTATSNDGSGAAWDFANAPVAESVMPTGGNGMIGNLGGMSRGPLGYATWNQDLNPPGITIWGVQRGFPRKHMLQSNAVLSVGTITDQISVADPFFGTING